MVALKILVVLLGTAVCKAEVLHSPRGMFPYHIALVVTYEDNTSMYLCDGVLIRRNYVVTLASCLFDDETDELYDNLAVVTGTNSVAGYTMIPKTSISAYIIHENYTPSCTNDDLALLKLKEKVKIDEFVAIAKLPVRVAKMSDKLMMVGFNTKDDISFDQQYVEAKVSDRELCQKYLIEREEKHFTLYDHQFCVNTSDYKDFYRITHGDTLIRIDKHMKPVLVGLLTKNNIVAIQISMYKNWIISKINSGSRVSTVSN